MSSNNERLIERADQVTHSSVQKQLVLENNNNHNRLN